jgi:hypothetical protein
MPTTARPTARGPLFMPVAMENRLAGPGAAARLAITVRKTANRDGSTGSVSMDEV